MRIDILYQLTSPFTFVKQYVIIDNKRIRSDDYTSYGMFSLNNLISVLKMHLDFRDITESLATYYIEIKTADQQTVYVEITSKQIQVTLNIPKSLTYNILSA